MNEENTSLYQTVYTVYLKTIHLTFDHNSGRCMSTDLQFFSLSNSWGNFVCTLPHLNYVSTLPCETWKNGVC